MAAQGDRTDSQGTKNLGEDDNLVDSRRKESAVVRLKPWQERSWLRVSLCGTRAALSSGINRTHASHPGSPVGFQSKNQAQKSCADEIVNVVSYFWLEI